MSDSETKQSKMGRPTKCTPELTEKLCEWLAGGKSLRSFAAQDDNPCLSAITSWIASDHNFMAQYAQARVAAGYAHADRIVHIVDKVGYGFLDPQAAKVMMDGLKWSAERMAPKSHSVRTVMDNVSSDGSMSPQRSIDASKLSDAALNELVDLIRGD